MPQQKFTRNRLLSALPRRELERLLPQLEVVPLGHKQVLYEASEPIHHVYFPENGVVSLLSLMENGDAVEIGTVGNEGMVGLPVFLGSVSTQGRAFSQVPGDAVRMRSPIFREEVGRGGRLRETLSRYTQSLFEQIAQAAACNRLHPMGERCARWLLMTHDRVGADEFPLTHEFLSQMLGVRRATVTVAVGMLQQAGLVQFTRGRVTVLSRAGLEEASCECYAIIRDGYERLLGSHAT
ncbi:Crp/Fnr family transcriptional regulator [Sorangium sp. So ce134]